MAQKDADAVLEKFALVFNDREPMTLDLTQTQNEGEKIVFRLKEGVTYKIELTFRVNNGIISGLRYHHASTRKGVAADKSSQMVGSYGPTDAPLVVLLREEYEAPKGMMYRGEYEFKSKFIDDDRICYKEFTWGMAVHKSWD